MLLCLHLLLLSRVSGQFVELKDKQFFLNDAAFYPTVLNFSMALYANSTTGGIYFAPGTHYGKTDTLECDGTNSCKTILKQNFAKVKSMGFNTIRIDVGMRYRNIPGTDSNLFAALVYDNTGSARQFFGRYRNLESPKYTDNHSLRYFAALRNLLDAADESGIKVIIIAADASLADPVDTTGMLSEKEDDVYKGNLIYGDNGAFAVYPTCNQQAIQDYADYLSELAKEFKDHPALLAYDLWNEPTYNHLIYTREENGKERQINSSEGCDIIKSWYAVLKLNDPNHLVTIGGHGPNDLGSFDYGAIDLDFYSLHRYPTASNADGYNSNYAYDRFNDIVYFLSKTISMPWIIGETGFTANDRIDRDNPEFHQPPYMYGSEAEQAAFAKKSMDLVRNCNGSGYSWWIYQDTKSYGKEFGYSENFYGLLGYGDAQSDSTEKQAVKVFRNYNYSTPIDSNQCRSSSQYFAQLDFADTLLTGTILNEEGEPISDVSVDLHVEKYHSDGSIIKTPPYSTHTDKQGRFVLKHHRETDEVETKYLGLYLSYPGMIQVLRGIWAGFPVLTPNAIYVMHKNLRE